MSPWLAQWLRLDGKAQETCLTVKDRENTAVPAISSTNDSRNEIGGAKGFTPLR